MTGTTQDQPPSAKESMFAPVLIPSTLDGLYFRELSAAEYLRFVESQQSGGDGNQAFMAAASTMIEMSLCDAAGESIFQPGDAASIVSKMPMSRLRLLADEALKANGLVGDKEDTAKNS